MALSNDSIRRNPDGSGTLIATQLVGDKEYQVVMRAGHQGHVRGSRPSYILLTDSRMTGASNKTQLDFWNGSSNATCWIHGIWAIPSTDTAITASVAIRIDVFRSTTTGTGGTAIGLDQTTATNSITSILQSSIPLPTDISARVQPTGGAVRGAFLGQWFLNTEETSTNVGYASQWFNGIRYSQDEDVADLKVKGGQGLVIKQGNVASVGSYSLRIAFSVTS